MKIIRKVLYLGIDPPPGVFHYPVIRTEKIDSPALEAAIDLWNQFTHVIFTSKNAVRYFLGDLRGKILIAIGEATAREISARGADALLAPEATQEGVVRLLETMDLSNAFILYPRSSRARLHLAKYLERREIHAMVFDLYDTVAQRPEPVPDLKDFDEIVFTAPSAVDGFLQIYSEVPEGISLISIGPVTKKALEEYFSTRI